MIPKRSLVAGCWVLGTGSWYLEAGFLLENRLWCMVEGERYGILTDTDARPAHRPGPGPHPKVGLLVDMYIFGFLSSVLQPYTLSPLSLNSLQL